MSRGRVPVLGSPGDGPGSAGPRNDSVVSLRWKELLRGFVACVGACLLTTLPAQAEPELLEPAARVVLSAYHGMILHLPERYLEVGATARLQRARTLLVNASADNDHGRFVLTMYDGMIDLLARMSYYVACVQTGRQADLEAGLRASHGRYPGGGLILALPPDAEQAMADPAFHACWELCLRSASTQVMGHELGHFCLGHCGSLGAANRTVAIDHAALIANAGNQRNELEADRFGIYAVGWAGLDYRASILFWKLMSIAEPSSRWRYLSTHPRSSLRARTLTTIVRALGR